jgi:hypothetical protein
VTPWPPRPHPAPRRAGSAVAAGAGRTAELGVGESRVAVIVKRRCRRSGDAKLEVGPGANAQCSTTSPGSAWRRVPRANGPAHRRACTRRCPRRGGDELAHGPNVNTQHLTTSPASAPRHLVRRTRGRACRSIADRTRACGRQRSIAATIETTFASRRNPWSQGVAEHGIRHPVNRLIRASTDHVPPRPRASSGRRGRSCSGGLGQRSSETGQRCPPMRRTWTTCRRRRLRP